MLILVLLINFDIALFVPFLDNCVCAIASKIHCVKGASNLPFHAIHVK